MPRRALRLCAPNDGLLRGHITGRLFQGEYLSLQLTPADGRAQIACAPCTGARLPGGCRHRLQCPARLECRDAPARPDATRCGRQCQCLICAGPPSGAYAVPFP
ncbi:hypothetical protein DSL92_03140 [Billgrantia gudaonensis]|uniref:Uncharacterized protein n=1 Tax=Billgrantia gudaonensis TaxID=376427 RepID=A0A3S0QRZ6_9GAMM|nr:hypothetical protein DSL92_03140 [Halomonas gudaonensis]